MVRQSVNPLEPGHCSSPLKPVRRNSGSLDNPTTKEIKCPNGRTLPVVRLRLSAVRKVDAVSHLTPTKFCIAMVERDEDDPFTFLLTHEIGREKPWTRYDLNAVVVSIAAEWRPDGTGRYAALTREGTVVFVDGEAVHAEVSPGAGLGSRANGVSRR